MESLFFVLRFDPFAVGPATRGVLRCFTGDMRRLLPALVVALCCAATPTADAARTTIKKSMWGPIEVAGKSQFPIYKKLGVGLWQYTIRWDAVAPNKPIDPSNPSDPVYQWPAELDHAIAEADKYGIKVSVMLIGAPRWANGGRDWQWAPKKPKDFATFAAAASRRYPRVRHWMIWSEPTKGSNWQPLEPDEGKPLRGAKELEGPRRYAQLLDRTFVALKRVTNANRVIGGNTFTVGTVAPFRWIRALKLPNGRRPRMDMWGHNPFSARKPKLNDVPLGSGFADFNDLDQLAKRLDKAFKKGPRKKQRHMKLFLSEYSLPTDHPNFEFNFYVSRKTQANWLKRALRISRRYKRIYTFGYLSLYDDALRPDNDQVERGLLTRDGERKPSFSAFRSG